MSDMPSPVLILGDTQLGKDTVVKAKKKYKSYYWETVNASKDSYDEIRMLAGFHQFGFSKKVVLITDLPNRKETRSFITDLVKDSSDSVKFVIWDSEGQIRIDPKKGVSKTWKDWIAELKKNKGCVVVNNGGDFAENDSKDSVGYVQSLFEKKKRTIDNVAAKIFVDLVGKNRAMLASEVNKLCFVAPQKVSKEFILERTFPSSKEAVIYKFSNDLDSNSYAQSISSLENFIQLGIDANVLGHVICNKARWHLVVCHLWSKGLDWNTVKHEILNMGKFPSCVWHNDQIPDHQKKSLAMDLGIPANMEEFMVRKMGLPARMLNIPPQKSSKKVVKRGEVIPMPFMADMMLSYVKKCIVAPNKGKYDEKELRKRMVDRAATLYLTCTDNLKQIRYEYDDQTECLHEMTKAWTNNIL